MNYAKALFMLVLITGALSVAGQSIPLDETRSKVDFTIKNFGLTVDGTIQKMSLSGNWDPENLAASSLNASVALATISSGIEARDKSLRSAEFFDAATYATIKLTSTVISKTTTGFLLTGKLTIKNITKEVQVPFTSTTKGNETVLMGTLVIDRREYTVGGNSMVMGDEVTVKITCVMLGK